MNERADPRRIETWTERLAGACPYLFLVLSLVSALFLAWNLPPFQGADELAHFDRVNMITAGRLVGERFLQDKAVVAGGPEEGALYAAAAPFDNLRFHPDTKVAAYEYAGAFGYLWGGATFDAEFGGSAIYPPFLYLPASLGAGLGKAMHRPVLQTLYMARVTQAVFCCLVGFLALLWARRSRLFLYGVLLLPMSAALYGSVTNDGPLIAVTALGCALICRAMSQARPLRPSELIGAAVCFALVGSTKLPYALFALVLLAVPAEKPRWRWIAAAAVLAASIAWTLWAAVAIQVAANPASPVANPHAQIAFLLAHPGSVATLAVHTLVFYRQRYLETFVGVLGWLDTYLPGAYYALAWAMLALALAVAAPSRWPAGWRRVPWTVVLVFLASFGGVYAALYITWSGVGAPTVEGVQGRYFLPLACFAGLALEGSAALIPDTRVGRPLRLALTGTVLAFPLISLLIVERAVILRYYLN